MFSPGGPGNTSTELHQGCGPKQSWHAWLGGSLERCHKIWDMSWQTWDFGAQNAAICTWLLKKWYVFWYCIIWLDVFLVVFVGCFFVYFWGYIHMIRPELDEYHYGCHGSGAIWWLCILSWGGENFAKSEVSKMTTVANGYTGWWQLKYFLCSALLGEMIQFD